MTTLDVSFAFPIVIVNIKGAIGVLSLDSAGVPLGALMVWPVIILKIVAGGMLMVGYRVGASAGALILFTLGTIVIAHADVNDVNLFKNLAIVGGLLYVLAYGKGGR